MNIKEMIKDIYEDKIVNLLESGFELSTESEENTNTYKTEIIVELLPMIQRCLGCDENHSDKEADKDKLYDTIYDLDNVWRNAIFNVFRKYDISDQLLNDSFENPSKTQQSIYAQWNK